MTNDLTISRELFDRMINALDDEGWHTLSDEAAQILAAPAVERQEPVGIESMPQYLILFDDTERPVETMFGEEIARKRYADISMSWNAHLFVKIDSNSRDAMFAKNNATVVTSSPAPVAVVLLERREPTPDNPYLSDADNEWNACIDKAKEMNQ